MTRYFITSPVGIDEVGFAAEGRANTKVLYVSPNGSNHDGLTWDTAYTTLPAALDACSTDVNDLTLLVCAPKDSYDIAADNPSWSCNVVIRGSHRHFVKIINSNVGAAQVLKFTGKAVLYNVYIECGTNSADGVVFSGSGADGSRFRFARINGNSIGGAHDVIRLEGGVKYIRFEDVNILGHTTRTTGLHFNNASYCKIEGANRFHIRDCVVGIHFDTTDDENNVIHDTHITGCTDGILIDANADNNHFGRLDLDNNTTNISDATTTSTWHDIEHDNKVVKILPETASTGSVVASKNIADTYADNYTQLDDGSSFTKPFYVVGAFLGNPSDVTATYLAKVAMGGAGSEVDIGRLMHDGAGKKAPGLPFRMETDIMHPGTRISANAMTENAVADTIQLWLLYIEI